MQIWYVRTSATTSFPIIRMNRLSAIGLLNQAVTQFCGDITVSQRRYPSFGDDHDILRGRKLGFVQSEKFAKQPLDPVSLHGIAGFFADRHAQPSDSVLVTAGDDGEMPRGSPYPLLIDPQIVLPFTYAFLPAECMVFRVASPLSGGPADRFGSRHFGYRQIFFLPLARLRLSTALPPRVAIRTRKPWVRFRLVLLNTVNVFFMIDSPF